MPLTTKAVNTFNVEDQKLSRIQQNLVTALNSVMASEIIDGVLVKSVDCVAGTPVNVKHGLNRTTVQVLVVNSFGAAPIAFSRASRTGNDPNYVTLTPSATGSADLWIF